MGQYKSAENATPDAMAAAMAAKSNVLVSIISATPLALHDPDTDQETRAAWPLVERSVKFPSIPSTLSST